MTAPTDLGRYDDAVAYLTTDSGRVPCSQWGTDSAACAPVAYAVALIISAEQGFGDLIGPEELDHAMSLVVNNHDDVGYLLRGYGTEHADWLRVKGVDNIYDLIEQAQEDVA